jgi:hypothetical protein
LRALSLCTCCRHYPGTATGGTASLNPPSRIRLPHHGSRVVLRISLFEACSAFTHVAACTLALPPYVVARLTEGFNHFVTSIVAPVASGWSGCRVGFAPTGKRRLFTAHAGTVSLRLGRTAVGRSARSPAWLTSAVSELAERVVPATTCLSRTAAAGLAITLFHAARAVANRSCMARTHHMTRNACPASQTTCREQSPFLDWDCGSVGFFAEPLSRWETCHERHSRVCVENSHPAKKLAWLSATSDAATHSAINSAYSCANTKRREGHHEILSG